MWINGKAVLHKGNTGTTFQNAVFIKGRAANALKIELINFWASDYIDVPETIRRDRESMFISNTIREYSENVKVELQFSGIQSPNSIGQGEQYDQSLGWIFDILCSVKPSLDDHHNLSNSI